MALLASLFAAALTQTTAPPPAAEPIVVEGTRQREKQVRDFVDALTGVPAYRQIGRFHSPVCLVAMGLPEPQNLAIAARMRRVAATANVPLAKVPCAPNAFVIVAPDKRAAILELNRRFPAYFWNMSAAQVRRMAASKEPAAAWQVRGLAGVDGRVAKKAVGAGYYVIESVNASRIKAASVPTFIVAVVVIDSKSAAGLTVTQLADYAAMRTLADIDPAKIAKIRAPTILNVLGQPDDRPLPITLTHWDLGFLKALYTTDSAYLAGYQRGDMEHVLRQELERAGEGPQR